MTAAPDSKSPNLLPERVAKYLSEVGEREIQAEATRGFSALTWMGSDLAGYVLGHVAKMDGVAPHEVFSALLKRRMKLQYGLDLGSRVGSSWGSDSDWARFEAGAPDWFAAQLSRPISSGQMRAGGRIGFEVQKTIEKRGKSLGWAISKSRGEGVVSVATLGSVQVRSCFLADSRGFSYWHDLQESWARVAAMRESYVSMFGISGQSEFRDLSQKSAEEVAEFVLLHAQRFMAGLEGFLRGEVAKPD